MRRNLLPLPLFLVAAATSAPAITIDAFDILADPNWTASVGTKDTKTQPCTVGPNCPAGSYTGVGITGPGSVPNQTDKEIDPGETLTGVFLGPVTLDFFQLSVLYDGQPEFKDYQEVAKITAYLSGGLVASYTLTATGSTTFAWTGLGTVVNVSPASLTEAAVWLVTNPFGTAAIDKLEFTALDGVCGGSYSCKDQSDYGVESLGYTAVPEPGSVALLCGRSGSPGRPRATASRLTVGNLEPDRREPTEGRLPARPRPVALASRAATCPG